MRRARRLGNRDWTLPPTWRSFRPVTDPDRASILCNLLLVSDIKRKRQRRQPWARSTVHSIDAPHAREHLLVTSNVTERPCSGQCYASFVRKRRKVASAECRGDAPRF